MKVLILGVCGTFMTGIARLALQLGFEVHGVDAQLKPPMSDILHSMNVQLYRDYDPSLLNHSFDMAIIGNVCQRNCPLISEIIDKKLRFYSGPEWLYQYILSKRCVLAVSGTHGKSTTTSLLIAMMLQAGRKVGYLVGAKMQALPYSADLGDDECFIIEADEYDSAFFDKRSKFLHYWPESLIVNGIEFDHADIFSDLSAVEKSFRYLLRLLPSYGRVIAASEDASIDQLLAEVTWCSKERFGLDVGQWQARNIDVKGAGFDICYRNECLARVNWSMLGVFNIKNALASAAMAYHYGVSISDIIDALSGFSGLKRRMELKFAKGDALYFDDFAHHPTAIASTLRSLKMRYPNKKVIALVQLSSYSMAQGVHIDSLQQALEPADGFMFYYQSRQPAWDVDLEFNKNNKYIGLFCEVNLLVDNIKAHSTQSMCFVSMGNSELNDLFNLLS